MDSNAQIRTTPSSFAGPSPGERIILLVHGFNNNIAEAKLSYFEMRKNLNSLLRESFVAKDVRVAFQERIWELYWPGFLPLSHASFVGSVRSGPEPAISAMSYSFEVIKGRDWVSTGLATFLETVQPSEVFLIGHSLGCRVILETIKKLGSPPKVNIVGFLLMAGAVPIDMLGELGSLREYSVNIRKRYCLHSRRDLVLFGAFPPGQIAAGEIPMYGIPVATGWAGAPKGFFSPSGVANTRLGHGGYWTRGPREGRSIFQNILSNLVAMAPNRKLLPLNLFSQSSIVAVKDLPSNEIRSRTRIGDGWLEQRFGPES